MGFSKEFKNSVKQVIRNKRAALLNKYFPDPNCLEDIHKGMKFGQRTKDDEYIYGVFEAKIKQRKQNVDSKDYFRTEKYYNRHRKQLGNVIEEAIETCMYNDYYYTYEKRW